VRYPYLKGDKVLCVDDTVRDAAAVEAYYPNWPTAGLIYTVRRVRAVGGTWGVWVADLANRIPPGSTLEVHFRWRRFTRLGPEGPLTRGSVERG
jgi:hypothetical protein